MNGFADSVNRLILHFVGFAVVAKTFNTVDRACANLFEKFPDLRLEYDDNGNSSDLEYPGENVLRTGQAESYRKKKNDKANEYSDNERTGFFIDDKLKYKREEKR